DIGGSCGVVCQFIFRMRFVAQLCYSYTQFLMPVKTLFQPLLVVIPISARFNKILHLHLFKLAHTKYKLSCYHFITERLTDLCNTKWNFLAGSIHYIFEVNKYALGCLRAQVNSLIITARRNSTKLSLKHQIELAHIGPVESP